VVVVPIPRLLISVGKVISGRRRRRINLGVIADNVGELLILAESTCALLVVGATSV
jgi:hypothetical protein